MAQDRESLLGEDAGGESVSFKGEQQKAVMLLVWS